MPYTDRQLACLSAMGLVAWRVRDGDAFVRGASGGTQVAQESDAAAGAVGRSATSLEATGGGSSGAARPGDDVFDAWPGAGAGAGHADVPPALSAPSAALPTDAESLVDAEPLTAPALATPLPREPAALAAWLPDQPLAPFVWKARRLTRIGRDDAPLLVVVEREPSEALPLSGDAAVLFERMLGAIGRTRRDTCQCVLASAPEPEGDTVAALAGDARPATLVLLHELDGRLDADGCRLPGDPFGGGAWCLPHPERLLEEPAAKRQAWLVLKAVRERLAGRAW